MIFAIWNLPRISRKLIFAVTTSTKTLRVSNFVVALIKKIFHDPIFWFREITLFTYKMTETIDGLEKTSQDIVSDRNSNFCGSSIFEKFCGNQFS